MLILSQDREIVTNLNGIANIWIGYDEIEKKYEINVTGVGYADGTLGYYETEERAKEVLKEIIKKYEMIQYGKYFKSPMVDLNKDNGAFYYEMPEK